MFVLTCGAFHLWLGSVARTFLQARPSAVRAVTRLPGAARVVIGALLLAGRLRS